ncbi:DUF2339 domain-containing protein [Exiguobacterium flavidum]|uniref:DUF2339 domain-containing protein n=1 Tax=Exiguobacterium flavidum TaxID=2184695 RepID=UPI001300A1CE|nr:DUF2339 domain-containing protein [Exiguobacterium flavidum]
MEERIERLEREIAELKSRVNALEAEKAVRPQSAPQITGAPAAVRPHYLEKTKRPAVKPKRSREEIEEQFAKVWLPRIATLFLAIGAIFLFSYAAINGWINPAVRVGIGVIAGLLLMGIGELQHQRGRKELAVGLVAGGTIVSLLALFAGMALYSFYSPPLAFLFELVILGIASGLMLWMRSQALLILIAGTGFLLPFMQLSEVPNLSLFLVYELILSIIITAAALKLNYRIAYFITFVFLGLSILLVSLSLRFGADDNLAEMTVVGISLLTYNATSYIASKTVFRTAWPIFPSVVLALLAIASTDWLYDYLVVFAFALIAYGAGRLLRFDWHYGIGHALLLIAVFWSPLEGSGYGAQIKLLMLALLLTLLYFLPRFRMPHQLLFTTVSYVLIFLFGLTVFAEARYVALPFWIGLFALIVMTGALIYALQSGFRKGEWRIAQFKREGAEPIYLLAIAVCAIGTLTTYSLFVVLMPFYEQMESIAKSATLSGAYILLALVLVGIGLVGDRSWRLAGLALMSVSAVKLIVFDLSFLSLPLKAAVFIGFGVAAFLISRTYFKRQHNKQQ